MLILLDKHTPKLNIFSLLLIIETNQPHHRDFQESLKAVFLLSPSLSSSSTLKSQSSHQSNYSTVMIVMSYNWREKNMQDFSPSLHLFTPLSLVPVLGKFCSLIAFFKVGISMSCPEWADLMHKEQEGQTEAARSHSEILH
jgi:hypothetical protein